MVFEYITNASFSFIGEFFRRFDISVQSNVYDIFEMFDSGFCRRYVIENGIIAAIQKFNLNQE